MSFYSFFDAAKLPLYPRGYKFLSVVAQEKENPYIADYQRRMDLAMYNRC